MNLDNKAILITGGTGSHGKTLVKDITSYPPGIKRLLIFSRDEQKQLQVKQEYPASQYPQIRFLIGDVCDKNRIMGITVNRSIEKGTRVDLDFLV